MSNQGWKDSHDAIFHADGTLAKGPIALCEVQGYVYAAKRRPRAAHAGSGHGASRRTGSRRKPSAAADGSTQASGARARHLRAGARRQEAALPRAQLQRRAGAVHRHRRPEQAPPVAETLLRPEFFSGWGIRTVAEAEARYNPMSYHNGSIWPHDNALIALGLARYGLKRPVERVFKGLFDAATYMEMRRLPELFCGFQRGRGRGPTLYPVACSPQAWASATPFTLLEASLGLQFDPAGAKSGCTIPACRRSWTKSSFEICSSRSRASTSKCAVMPTTCRWKCWNGGERSRSPSYSDDPLIPTRPEHGSPTRNKRYPRSVSST